MDYSKLSDDELSIEVVKFKFGFSCYMQNGKVRALNPDGDDFYFDINNPLDAWPIIVENNISLNPILNYQSWICKLTGAWLAGVCSGKFSAKDKNPLRCAMIVYLMMQEQ